MSFMKWDEKYAIGVPEMDEQHRHWLDMLNKFYDSLGDGSIEAQTKALLDEAMAYTDYHFREEEAYLSRIHYPNLTSQHEKHEAIQAHMKAYREKLDQGRLIVTTPVTSEMKLWFSEHILKEDRAYADYARNHRA